MNYNNVELRNFIFLRYPFQIQARLLPINSQIKGNCMILASPIEIDRKKKKERV